MNAQAEKQDAPPTEWKPVIIMTATLVWNGAMRDSVCMVVVAMTVQSESGAPRMEEYPTGAEIRPTALDQYAIRV